MEPRAITPPALVTIGLICLATWALSHSYLGLFHDAGLYTLQALSHLHPGSLKHDVFLRFGSQDRFTLFSPIYAGASRWLGVEPAAALLTLLSQAALLATAFALARTILPAPLPPFMALFGLAVVIAIPGYYGADRIFTCIEPFLTPRMASEALTLASLAAAMNSRRILSGLLLAAALLIHPVMAAAGLVTLLCLYVVAPPRYLSLSAAAASRPSPTTLKLANIAAHRPRLMLMLGAAARRPQLALMLAAAAALLSMTLLASLTPTGPFVQFDPTWLSLIQHRSPYLFLAQWSLDDASRAAVTLATLALGARVLPTGRARALSRAVLIAVLGGFALTGIACDLLHIVFFTQLQPWRWEWAGSLVAAMLLPLILGTMWRRDSAGRTGALLLVAAWLFASNAYALVATAAALASVAFVRRLKPTEARWVFWGACALLALAVIWRVASNLEFTDAYSIDPGTPLWIRRSMSFVRDGSAPLALMVFVYWLSRTRQGARSVPVVGLLVLVACCALVPQTWGAWTARAYAAGQVAQFAALRAQIPEGADVFWPEAPVATWLLLDRPSYLSVIQTSGMVFSRDSALELNRRAQRLSSAVSADTFMDWSSTGTGLRLSRAQLLDACATGGFKFLVTPMDLGLAPLASVQSATGPATNKIRLYGCGI